MISTDQQIRLPGLLPVLRKAVVPVAVSLRRLDKSKTDILSGERVPVYYALI